MKKEGLSIKVSIISAIVCGLAFLYFFVDARYSAFYPKCPFFALTGLYCPGCGSQRAASALLHGDIVKAFNYNLLLAVSLPFVLYSAFVNLVNVFRTSPVTQKIFYSPAFVKIVFVAVLLFGIMRNIPVYPFTMLAP